MQRAPWILFVLLAAAACDTRATAAKAGDNQPVDRQSQELESCGTTAHCAPGLRCFAQTCQRVARSTLGDYLAARGARAASVEAAIADYAEALATYESEQLAVPPDLDCAYGRALGRAKAQKDKAELSARVLHRCLIAVPPGSALRAEALGALTELDGAGLDPKQIAKPALADLYLTRSPDRPSTEGLTVKITADPPPTGKTFPLVIERLQAADVRGALLACWEKAAENNVLVARLPFQVIYKASEYEDEPGTYKIVADAPAGANVATACVQAVAGPLLTGLKGVRDKIETTLVVTVK